MKTCAIYAGSFSPFHIGHLDIARKAKSIFDDVFIVQAHNDNKSIPHFDLPFDFLHTEGFKCVVLDEGDLLTDFISRIENRSDLYGPYSSFGSICLVRGLRNTHDFVYEENLAAAYRCLKPNINIIHFLSKPENNFISSSLLRKNGNLPEFYKLIVK